MTIQNTLIIEAEEISRELLRGQANGSKCSPYLWVRANKLKRSCRAYRTQQKQRKKKMSDTAMTRVAEANRLSGKGLLAEEIAMKMQLRAATVTRMLSNGTGKYWGSLAQPTVVKQIIKLTGEGLTREAVAEKLGIARSTVQRHLANARK